MARGKVTTNTELRNENASLQNKVDKLKKQNSLLLQRVGGLRAHIQQNSVEQTEILRLLESIISDS